MSIYKQNKEIIMSNLDTFRKQMEEDIRLIQEDKMISYKDNYVKKKEYAFNYWVLSKIFNLDYEIIQTQITEYNDKAIDCWIHSPERKEICIIQNKFYSIETPLDREIVADFLKTPLSILNKGNYKKSQELQNIYNQNKDDKDYSINLCFFITKEKVSDDIIALFDDFNKQNSDTDKATVKAYLYTLKDMYEKYYGKLLSKNPDFSCEISTPNKGTFASVRDEYGITDLKAEAYYIITPVTEIYKLFQEAKESSYNLFEENIRDFLGRNKINKGIINTLKDLEERKQFLFYNNGITLICQNIESAQHDGKRLLTLKMPQIINGCQTTNSICEVLSNLPKKQQNPYSQVYVMVKALVVKENDKSSKTFYENVVKYTNRQNAIKDKAFSSNENVFKRLQVEFEKRGIMLLISPSDKNTYSEKINKKKISINVFIDKASKIIKSLNFTINKKGDLYISLDKMLQVFVAFYKGGHFAYTKKQCLLDRDHELFNQVSTKMQDYITYDDLIKLYFLYYKADKKRKEGEDKRSPIPYYVLGFLGSFIETEKNHKNIKQLLDKVFSEKFDEIFSYLSLLTKKYMRRCAEKNIEYNNMVKKDIDEVILSKVKEDLSDDDKYKKIAEFLKTK